MPAKRSTRWVPILGGVVGGAYSVFGLGELVTHLDEPASLLFWLPTLWGGGALVLYGTFARAEVLAKTVIAGAVLGSVATAWTLILPVLAIALVVLVLNAPKRAPGPA